jgi:hypothetical protein
MAIIARVRRAMPRNQDVMAICDAAEKSLVAVKPRFDKKTYQRELMRKRRAAGKAK